jgi:hypothetical protein
MASTDPERARICELYTQCRTRLGLEGRSETRRQTITRVATQVQRTPQAVQYTLILNELVPPPRPDLDESEMDVIARTYLQYRSIRDCARAHRLPYGTVRNVLLYKGVKLRSPGGPRAVRS